MDSGWGIGDGSVVGGRAASALSHEQQRLSRVLADAIDSASDSGATAIMRSDAQALLDEIDALTRDWSPNDGLRKRANAYAVGVRQFLAESSPLAPTASGDPVPLLARDADALRGLLPDLVARNSDDLSADLARLSDAAATGSPRVRGTDDFIAEIRAAETREADESLLLQSLLADDLRPPPLQLDLPVEARQLAGAPGEEVVQRIGQLRAGLGPLMWDTDQLSNAITPGEVAEIAAILQRAINDAGPRADDLVELATALARRAGQAQGEVNTLSLTTREAVELDEALREALNFIDGA